MEYNDLDEKGTLRLFVQQQFGKQRESANLGLRASWQFNKGMPVSCSTSPLAHTLRTVFSEHSSLRLFPTGTADSCSREVFMATVLRLPLKDALGREAYGEHVWRVSGSRYFAGIGVQLTLIMLLAGQTQTQTGSQVRHTSTLRSTRAVTQVSQHWSAAASQSFRLTRALGQFFGFLFLRCSSVAPLHWLTAKAHVVLLRWVMLCLLRAVASLPPALAVSRV